MVMLPREWGRGRAVSELWCEGKGEAGARGLSGEEMKLAVLKEREGARSPGRRGASNVGVVGVERGELWNWSSTSECRSLSSFVGGDDMTGELGPLVVSTGCQFVGISL